MMKFVYMGENLREPATLETSDRTETEILEYLLNMERSDLRRESYPPVISYRVWGNEIPHKKFGTMYDIWVEYTVGHIGQWQKYVKHEYLVRRIK